MSSLADPGAVPNKHVTNYFQASLWVRCESNANQVVYYFILQHVIWTENLPGVNTYLQTEKNWTSDYADCTGSLAENRSYRW